MKLRLFAVVGIILYLVSCAPYKQLQPKPELTPAEQGYLELKNGKKDFKLKKEKKYFIVFPAAQEDNFYLVLSHPQKKSLNSYLTDKLIDKKTTGAKIPDESENDTQSVFPIGKSVPEYYFIMERIGAELDLKLNYRYTPQWRFKFENKHTTYREILAANRVDRKTYESIAPGKYMEGMDFPSTISAVDKNKAAIDEVYKQLLAIESIFPSSIVNSQDEAYLNYKKLKAEIEDEIAFQEAYLATLHFFDKEFTCRGNPLELVKSVEDFITFFKGKDKIAPAVISEAKAVIERRLTEIPPFYNQRLKGKSNATPFEQETFFVKELLRIGDLYKTAMLQAPAEYTSLAHFVKEYNERSGALIAVEDSLKAIHATIDGEKNMPSDDFLPKIVKRAQAIKSRIPNPLDESFADYADYNCSENYNMNLANFTKQFEKDLANYQEASTIIPNLNTLKSQKDYSTMLGLLKQKPNLAFLYPKYEKLDMMSVQEQGIRIGDALKGLRWGEAEKLLTRLHTDNNFLKPSVILPIKREVVQEYEDSLYIRIDRYSRQRIDKFVKENYKTVENVDSLYTDSVFLPAYDVTFSSGSRGELIQRKNDLIAHLAKTKENQFPAKAITLLSKDFFNRPKDNGVLKARAVVTHGKYYKGDDKKIKRIIAECDPWRVKWIVKPKQYRRVLAVPVTDKRRGTNKYVVRMNIDIKTDAQFPVYDVNIKLPEVIAKNAGTQQWYDKITLNKKEVKIEGRVTLTAPTKANEFTCQITPVQMRKDKGNVLEITFLHKSFTVHPVSVMVQKPIIKKN